MTTEEKIQALQTKLQERMNSLAAQDPTCQRLLGRIEGLSNVELNENEDPDDSDVN